MLYPFLAVSAVVPSLLLIWYFHSRDVYPEPQKVVWATFGLSVLSVIPVLITALPVKFFFTDNIADPWLGGVADAFLTAAIPEEVFKFLVVFGYAARHKEFDEPMDGIVYGVVGSLGFATLENIMYIMQGGLAVAVARAITAVPCHAFLGAIMGYYIGQYKFSGESRKSGNLFKALFWPILLHGLYNTPLLIVPRINRLSLFDQETMGFVILGLIGCTLAVLIVEWVWAIKLTRRLRKDQKAQQEAEAAASLMEPLAPVSAQPVAVPLVASAPPSVASGVPGVAQTAHQPAGGSGKPMVWRTTKGSPFAPVVMSVGVIFASFGGLIFLGLILAGFQGELGHSIGEIIAGTVVVGVLPLVLGIWLFVRGLKRLPKRVLAEDSVPGA